jgi:hypothetical protein
MSDSDNGGEGKGGPTLNFTEPSDEPNINVLLYGPPGTGKTVGAASTPGPTLYLNADRPNATAMAHRMFPGDLHEAKVEDVETLTAAMLALRSGNYRSIVVDPLADVYRIVLEGLSNRAMRPQIQDYGDTGTYLERFVRALCDEPVHAVFVAHEAPVHDEETGGFERLPFTGTKNPAFAAKLMALVDVIGYTGVVDDDDGGGVQYVAQLVNGRGRRGKDRFGTLGTSREINIAEWVDLAHKATKRQEAAA